MYYFCRKILGHGICPLYRGCPLLEFHCIMTSCSALIDVNYNRNWSRRHTAFRSVHFALIGAHQYNTPAKVHRIIS